MQLCQFIKFNHTCPVCNKPLKLYMQWISKMCFKEDISKLETLSDETIHHFIPFWGKDEEEYQDESVLLHDYGTNFDLECSSSGLWQKAKQGSMYFFYLCDESGIKEKKYDKNDYDISLYYACYYRSTPIFELREQADGPLTLDTINPDHRDLINKDEAFAFKSQCNDLEKVYMLNLDHENNQTALWHYSVTEEQKKIDNFKPKLFEKKMPPLPVRPKFDLSNRERLISRFDNWILMS